MEGLFRNLSPDEELQFAAWARENYKPFDPIPGIWHPVIQAECAKINKEAGQTPLPTVSDILT